MTFGPPKKKGDWQSPLICNFAILTTESNIVRRPLVYWSRRMLRRCFAVGLCRRYRRLPRPRQRRPMDVIKRNRWCERRQVVSAYLCDRLVSGCQLDQSRLTECRPEEADSQRH